MSNFDFVEKVMTIGGNGTEIPTLQFYKKGFRLGTGATPSWQDIILSGNTALTLTNALANSLNYLKLFGNTEQRNLPSEYTQIEYIETTGTQYIDTGIILPSTFHIKMKIKFYSFDPQFGFICGARNKNAQTGRLGITLIRQGKKLGFDIDEDISHRAITSELTLNTWYTVEFIVDSTGSKFLLDGTLISTVNTKPSTVNYPLYIFDSNTANATTDYMGTFDLCDFQINGLANYIASRDSDNVLGMYDTVTGNFLTNQGTGTFTAGADVIPTPDNPMDIVCNNGVVKVSPNLFNADVVLGGTLDNSQQGIDGNQNPKRARLEYTFLKAGTYTLSNTDNIEKQVLYCSYANADGSGFIDSSTPWNWNNTLPYTFTITSDRYMRFMVKNGDNSDFTNDNIGNFQIEQGSTATPYMPYGQIYVDGTTETVEIDTTGNTATAENLFKVGDYQDVQSVIDGGVTRNVGIKVLNGTENWNYISGNTPRFRTLINTINDLGLRLTPLYSTHFLCVSDGRPFSQVPNNSIYTGGGTGGEVFIHSSDFGTSVESFKQWLADQYANGTPVIIAYPLATATTETVTGQPMNIQAGTNIVEITQASIDNLELEVKYKAIV